MSPRRRRVHRYGKSRKLILITGLLVAVAAVAIVAYIVMNSSGLPPAPGSNKNKVLFVTSMGNITITLRDGMPITTTNFKTLVEQGKYDGTVFHRVIAGFMIQGGQINSSWPSIQDEFGSNNHNARATIAMAKTSEPNSASTQFLINVANNTNRYASFDSTFAVFGDVTDGMNIVDTISHVATDSNYAPLVPVTLIKAELTD
jgi:cyclophilin family peptidyl-prolyl cis-trans isomerase